MRRPIVLITLLLICGIYIGSYTKIPIFFTIGIGLLAWVCCFMTFSVRKCSIFSLPCLAIFFLIASTAYYDSRTDILSVNHIEYILTTQKSLLRISGTIINPPVMWNESALNRSALQIKSGQIPKKSHYKISFTIRVEAVETVVIARPPKAAVAI